MKFDESLRIIESASFDAAAGLASGYASFCRIITRQEAFTVLIKVLREEKKSKEVVLSRIAALAKKRADTRYINSFDTAFATYLHSLSLVDSDIAQIGAVIVSDVENCHWASRIAHHLLSFVMVEDIRSRADSVDKQVDGHTSRNTQGIFSETVYLSFGGSDFSKAPVQRGVARQGQVQETRFNLSGDSLPSAKGSHSSSSSFAVPVRYVATAL